MVDEFGRGASRVTRCHREDGGLWVPYIAPAKHHCGPRDPRRRCTPLCGPLIAGEGPVKPVAGSQRTDPSTARKGNTQVASVTCLVPTGASCGWWRYEQAGKGSADRVLSRGGVPTVLLKASNSGDCFLTVAWQVVSASSTAIVGPL